MIRKEVTNKSVIFLSSSMGHSRKILIIFLMNLQTKYSWVFSGKVLNGMLIPAQVHVLEILIKY